MRNILLFLTLILLSGSAFAGKKSKCDGVYETDKEKKKEKDKDFLITPEPILRLLSEIRRITLERHALITEDNLGKGVAKLLKHAGFVRHQTENWADLKKEKGFRLGAQLENEMTIEFIFEPNDLVDKKIFNLRSIILIEKNGKEHIITEDPTISEGTDLREKEFSYLVERDRSESGRFKDTAVHLLNEKGMKDLRKKAEAAGVIYKTDVVENSDLFKFLRNLPRRFHPSDRAKIQRAEEATPVHLEVPVLLRPEIIAELKKWVPRLPFLEPKELRDINSEADLNALFWKFKYRSIKTSAKEVNAAQLKKWGLRGAYALALIYLLDLRIDIIDQIINNTKSKVQSGIRFLTPEQEKEVLENLRRPPESLNKIGVNPMTKSETISLDIFDIGLENSLTIIESQKQIHYRGIIRGEDNIPGRKVSILLDGRENPLLYEEILSLANSSVNPPK